MASLCVREERRSRQSCDRFAMAVSDETDCNDVKIADLPRPAPWSPWLCRQSSELFSFSCVQIFCWDSDNARLDQMSFAAADKAAAFYLFFLLTLQLTLLNIL